MGTAAGRGPHHIARGRQGHLLSRHSGLPISLAHHAPGLASQRTQKSSRHSRGIGNPLGRARRSYFIALEYNKESALIISPPTSNDQVTLLNQLTNSHHYGQQASKCRRCRGENFRLCYYRCADIVPRFARCAACTHMFLFIRTGGGVRSNVSVLPSPEAE